MTENEAIKKLEPYLGGIDSDLTFMELFYKDVDRSEYLADRDAFTTAITALKEIQQYREIGTVEECREAVEKQKPKVPAVDKYHHTCCPSCGWVVAGDTGYGKEYLPHCENCGQKILWDERMEETEDDG